MIARVISTSIRNRMYTVLVINDELDQKASGDGVSKQQAILDACQKLKLMQRQWEQQQMQKEQSCPQQ
jgi:hypothetical protein